MQQVAKRGFFQHESYIYPTRFTELDKYEECWKKSSFATSSIQHFFAIPKNTHWVKFYVKFSCILSINRLNQKHVEKCYFSKQVLKSSTFQHPFECWKVELFSIYFEKCCYSILLFLVQKSRLFRRSRMTGKVSSFTTVLQKVLYRFVIFFYFVNICADRNGV